MNKGRINNYLLDYAEQKLALGKQFFTQDELKHEFISYSKSALISALNRLKNKGKVVSIHKGFYLIIPPDRMAKGILPPQLFIDSLMGYLGRAYYVGLLSASVYYGASHQQAQEYFVFINKPSIREIRKKGLKLNFVIKSHMPKVGIEKRKTESGYVNVSSAELTAIDLVKYENNVGGINRATSVISELVEEMRAGKLKEALYEKGISTPIIQRLGYILDKLNEGVLAQVALESMNNKRISKVPLKTGIKKGNFPLDKKWKIIENIELDLEF